MKFALIAVTALALSPAHDWRSEEITAGTREWRLPGTLLMPVGKGPFPGVVLVQGSGPIDRDGSEGSIKPLRDLAEGLAARGIAVLRYDKRTLVFAEKMAAMKNVTLREESVDDAVAAAALLRSRAGVDPDRVFVLGHSMGGCVAPRVGARDPRLAGLIVLAGNARPPGYSLLEQIERALSSRPGLSAENRRQLEQMKQAAGRVIALKPGDTVAPADLPFGRPAAYWLDWKAHDPPSLARGLKMRMLILQGERDEFVMLADFALWKEALGPRKDVKLRTYPSLDHFFRAGESGHVAPEVIDDVATWILEN